MKKDKIYVENQIWTDKPRNFLGLPLNFTRYILTPDRIITRKGFLNQREDKVMLYRIYDSCLHLPLSQRIFKCGTLMLHAYDSDTAMKTIRSIKNVRQISALIEEHVETARTKYNIPAMEMVGSAINPDYN